MCTRHSASRETQITARKFALDDFVALSIREAGELIRHEPVEHAVIYTPTGKALFYAASRSDSPYTVTVPLWKAGLIRGNVFVHNHPGSESFSTADVLILIRHGAREVHAYGPERSFRMIAAKRTRRFGHLEEAAGTAEVAALYGREVKASAARFQRFVQAGLLSGEDAWAASTHSAMRRISERFGFAYQEI